MKTLVIKAKGKLDNFLYSWFVKRKIKVQWHNQYNSEIKINYVDTHKIDERNIVDISKTNQVQIFNYTNLPTLYGKSERSFNHFQLKFLALLSKSQNMKTINSVQSFWKLTYRQAYYVKSLYDTIISETNYDLNYYLNLFYVKKVR